MKGLLSVLAVTLFVGLMATAMVRQKRAYSDSTPNRLVGAWRLVWLEEPGVDGKIQKPDCTGLLVYTDDGHMSVQVMYRNYQNGGGVASAHYAQGGYEASYGTYVIDSAHTFTFHVEGALVRTLVGQDLKRMYEFSGNQMIVKSSNPDEHWRVAWEHY
jgi:hypothetical protein